MMALVPFNTPPAKSAPLLIGAALLGTGLALRHWKPLTLSLPKEPNTLKHDRGARRRARQARDGIARFLPANLNASVGNSLLILGTCLVALRVLDQAVEEQERLF